MVQGTAAAGHLNADAALEPDHTEQPDKTDFAGGFHMGTAAGAQITAGELHQPHVTGQLLFAAIGQGSQGLRVGVKDRNRRVGPRGLIGPALDVGKLLHGQFAVEIDGNDVMAYMKSHIVITVGRVNETADDMLAAVLLHEVQPPLPVNGALHRVAHGQGPGAAVDNLPIPAAYVGDGYAAQQTGVTGLAAALGIKGRLIQSYKKSIAVGGTGQHPGRELPQMAVLIKKCLLLHGEKNLVFRGKSR